MGSEWFKEQIKLACLFLQVEKDWKIERGKGLVDYYIVKPGKSPATDDYYEDYIGNPDDALDAIERNGLKDEFEEFKEEVYEDHERTQKRKSKSQTGKKERGDNSGKKKAESTSGSSVGSESPGKKAKGSKKRKSVSPVKPGRQSVKKTAKRASRGKISLSLDSSDDEEEDMEVEQVVLDQDDEKDVVFEKEKDFDKEMESQTNYNSNKMSSSSSSNNKKNNRVTKHKSEILEPTPKRAKKSAAKSNRRKNQDPADLLSPSGGTREKADKMSHPSLTDLDLEKYFQDVLGWSIITSRATGKTYFMRPEVSLKSGIPLGTENLDYFCSISHLYMELVKQNLFQNCIDWVMSQPKNKQNTFVPSPNKGDAQMGDDPTRPSSPQVATAAVSSSIRMVPQQQQQQQQQAEVHELNDEQDELGKEEGQVDADERANAEVEMDVEDDARSSRSKKSSKKKRRTTMTKDTPTSSSSSTKRGRPKDRKRAATRDRSATSSSSPSPSPSPSSVRTAKKAKRVPQSKASGKKTTLKSKKSKPAPETSLSSDEEGSKRAAVPDKIEETAISSLIDMEDDAMDSDAVVQFYAAREDPGTSRRKRRRGGVSKYEMKLAEVFFMDVKDWDTRRGSRASGLVDWFFFKQGLEFDPETGNPIGVRGVDFVTSKEEFLDILDNDDKLREEFESFKREQESDDKKRQKKSSSSSTSSSSAAAKKKNHETSTKKKPKSTKAKQDTAKKPKRGNKKSTDEGSELVPDRDEKEEQIRMLRAFEEMNEQMQLIKEAQESARQQQLKKQQVAGKTERPEESKDENKDEDNDEDASSTTPSPTLVESLNLPRHPLLNTRDEILNASHTSAIENAKAILGAQQQ